MLIDKYVLIFFFEMGITLSEHSFKLQHNENNLLIMTFIPEADPSSIFPLTSCFYSCQLRPNFYNRSCFPFTRILFAPYKIFGTFKFEILEYIYFLTKILILKMCFLFKMIHVQNKFFSEHFSFSKCVSF